MRTFDYTSALSYPRLLTLFSFSCRSYRSARAAAAIWLVLLGLSTPLRAEPTFSDPEDVPPSFDSIPGHLEGFAAIQMASFLSRKAPTFSSMLQLDGGLEFRHVEILLVPRLRIDDFQNVKQSKSLFFQQAFIALRDQGWSLKVGKVLGQFGRIWDYGLYGPLLANTDVKLTPDYGLSLESTHSLSDTFQLFWALQFFFCDGKALSVGNPRFFTLDYARRRNITALRIQPSMALADGRLSVALSGQHFQSVREQMQHVWRVAADVDYTRNGFDAFVEAGYQFGKDIPSTLREEVGSHGYIWAGAQKLVGPFLIRHHVNVVWYPDEHHLVDVLHQPGVEWLAAKNFSLIAEGAFWHNAPNIRGRGDRSLFVVALGKF